MCKHHRKFFKENNIIMSREISVFMLVQPLIDDYVTINQILQNHLKFSCFQAVK